MEYALILSSDLLTIIEMNIRKNLTDKILEWLLDLEKAEGKIL